MAEQVRWGIIGPGNIARQFAEGLAVSKTGTLVAAGSRTLSRAEEFCAKHGGKAYGSYEEVLNNPEVDAVYIATPHHTHMNDTIACAKAGKAILCEKPFTLNALEAERALAAVREAGVFFMEAFMYRCTAQTAKIREWIDSGIIGEVKLVNTSFAFQAGEEWANFRNDPALGGGGLMDVGAYCVSLARLAFGEEPSDAWYVSQPSSKGVDWIGSGMLKFSGNRSAVFQRALVLSAATTRSSWEPRGASSLMILGRTARVTRFDATKVGTPSLRNLILVSPMLRFMPPKPTLSRNTLKPASAHTSPSKTLFNR
ncbi:MAG: dehydrogenase [Armatimonadetes bacterium Cent15-Ar3]|nr:MAG: dehydrogenase [Armatimonadetes bacterium Cent15-Ar3]